MITLNDVGCPEDCEWRMGEDNDLCYYDFKNPCEVMRKFLLKFPNIDIK